uniref:Uncharacterized protein n=1 Tax=Ditylenchus dipsaci TaxID=166011 RepID=A0A915DV03_9BILA
MVIEQIMALEPQKRFSSAYSSRSTSESPEFNPYSSRERPRSDEMIRQDDCSSCLGSEQPKIYQNYPPDYDTSKSNSKSKPNTGNNWLHWSASTATPLAGSPSNSFSDLTSSSPLSHPVSKTSDATNYDMYYTQDQPGQVARRRKETFHLLTCGYGGWSSCLCWLQEPVETRSQTTQTQRVVPPASEPEPTVALDELTEDQRYQMWKARVEQQEQDQSVQLDSQDRERSAERKYSEYLEEHERREDSNEAKHHIAEDHREERHRLEQQQDDKTTEYSSEEQRKHMDRYEAEQAASKAPPKRASSKKLFFLF